MTIFTNVNKEQFLKLAKNFIAQTPKTAYEQLRLTKGKVTLILYTSGKLLLQGNAAEVKALVDEICKAGIGETVAAEHFRKESGWIIGSDESLKGDTFGGLVVAAVKANESLRQQLIELGVADSKTLFDGEIIPLAEKIRKLVPCAVRNLVPEEYNRGGKITHLLNALHAECAKDLSSGKHIVDKFPGCLVGDVAEEKAESKYVEVAAASILARAAALEQFNFLSVQAGFTLPKGSTHVKEALAELKRRGLEFRKFVKVDFRNVREFL